MQIPRSLAGQTVVVTGARGFIGSRLVRTLASREGARVTALVRSGGRNLWRDLPEVSVATDISAVAGAAVVINLAYDFSAPADELLTEFDTLIEACKTAHVGALVQFSSIAVYDGWPGGDLDETSLCEGAGGSYKKIKRAMERRLAETRVPHTILQPTIVYGAGSPQWTDKILQQARSGTIILPDGPEGLCHAVHVDDVVDAAICAARLQVHRGARYIVSGPAPVGWRAFYAAHLALLGRPPPVLKNLPAGGSATSSASGVKAAGVRRALRIVRSRLPPQAIARVKQLLSAARRLGRPAQHYPSPTQLELLRARGSCSTARAAEDLGFRPRIDFATGMQLLAEALARRR